MMASTPIRVVFAGGGTGGHLYPALALADRLRELVGDRFPIDIRFVGTTRGIEYRLRESLGYPLHLIPIRGIARSFTLANLLVPFAVIWSLLKSRWLLKRLAPRVVVGTGGYVAWPVLRMAAMMGLPTVIQEQNSFPGITTRRLARHAHRVFLGFDAAREMLHTTAPIETTGNPVRRTIISGDREKALAAFGLDPSKKTILILGGSQGARAVNNAILDSLEKKALPEDYQLLWQTGRRDYTDVAARAGNKVSGPSLFPFAENMSEVYAAADIAIARAGALTLAELETCGIPSILVPYPYAAGDHQRKNAEAFVTAGAAVQIDQSQFDHTDLLDEAVAILSTDRYQGMCDALSAITAGRRPAVDVIVEHLLAIIEDSDRKGNRP